MGIIYISELIKKVCQQRQIPRGTMEQPFLLTVSQPAIKLR